MNISLKVGKLYSFQPGERYSAKILRSMLEFPIKLYPEPSYKVNFTSSFFMNEMIVVLEVKGSFTKVLASNGNVGYVYELGSEWKEI
jgi:hypothetical protein